MQSIRQKTLLHKNDFLSAKNWKRFFLFGVFFLTLFATAINVSARVPNDREQYLKLGELLELINNLIDSGLRQQDFQEIRLKDNNRVITLTQFSQLFEYIQKEVPFLTDEIKEIKFDPEKLKINSYEYVKSIIEAQKARNAPQKKPDEKIYISNYELQSDMDKKGDDRLTYYR